MIEPMQPGLAHVAERFRPFIYDAATVLGWILPFTALMLSQEASRSHSYLLYGIQLILFGAIWHRTGRLVTLLSPAALVILYVDASFMLGNYAFGRGLVLIPANMDAFRSWTHLHQSNAYILIMNVLLFQLDAHFRRKAALRPEASREAIQPSWQASLAMVSAFFLVAFSIFRLDVEILGGSGNMSSVPKAISILTLISILAYKGFSWRFPVYAIILMVSATFTYTNKRETIFLVFPILLIEAVMYRRPLRLSTYIGGASLGFFLAALIIVMSIMRGYGGFDLGTGGLLTLAPYVLSYLQVADFLPYFFNNIETNYTYFHTLQAMEYIFADPGLLAFGSTVIKFLFIAIPSSILSWKPESFVNSYTTLHDPNFRALGGSWPPNVFAEMFWNFHLLGLVALPAIFWVFSTVYYRILDLIRTGRIISHSWLLFAYMQVMTFARGSGLDMFLVYVMFGAFFSLLYLLLVQFASIRTTRSRLSSPDARGREA